ncbi:MAG: DUF4837 family protein, partial [Bacteroidales bacterium]|nr:DUF4837 family protein [Bacteroidales bacterium]
MRRIISILASVLAVIGLASCSGTGKALLPNVSGKAGEVIVVIERADWEGALGNEVRDLLAADCPWLYIREPLYSVVNIAPGGFADLFKIHRNIVIFQIDPQIVNPGVIVKNDVWATPQCVIQVAAHDSDEAVAILKEKGATLVSAIEQAERDRVISNTILYEESTIRTALNEIFGGSPRFPSGYKLRMSNDHFAWMEDRKQYVTQGVFVYKYPVPKDDPFTMESIISKRNAMLQENVPGMFENTYMTT